MKRFFLILMCAFGVGCSARPEKREELPVVPVAKPLNRMVTDFVYYTGRTNAMLNVTIVPRVTGYIKAIPFKEGEHVKKGDILFKIDPRPYKAQLDAALAQVDVDKAGKEYAVATNRRYQDLAVTQPGAVSKRELDQYKALEAQATAKLLLSEANLEAAKLNFKWTDVESPIDGYISRYYLTVGNLVNQDVTQLTTVVSVDPMYVYFDMDEPTMLRITKAIIEGKMSPLREGSMTSAAFWGNLFGLFSLQEQGPLVAGWSVLSFGRDIADVPVYMQLQGEEGFTDKGKPRHPGAINFMDNQVNPGTDSISVRGVFPNPKQSSALSRRKGAYLLVPGMFVRVRMPIGRPEMSLLIAEKAVITEQGGQKKKVYVIDSENKVQARTVELGQSQGDGLRVVTKGIKADDWVLFTSLQHVSPGKQIRPEFRTMPEYGQPSERLEKFTEKAKGKGKK